MVKLDRVLFNLDWDAMFPDCILQALSLEMSDHCPLLLSTDAGFKPSRRFRFEDAWIKREDFAATVESAWLSTPAQIDPFINLHHKLTATAKKLTAWNSQFMSDLELRAAISSELIFRLDQAMDCRQLSPDEVQFRGMLKMNRLGLAAIQRTMWRQRSQIQWLREGDASTCFFHAKASARRRKSFIHRIQTDSGVFTDQCDKEDAILGYFKSLLGTPRHRSHSLNLHAMGISRATLDDQEEAFTAEEIQAALAQLPAAKFLAQMVSLPYSSSNAGRLSRLTS
jgi:hypothetical protein